MLQLERPRSLTALVLDRLRQGIVCGDVGLGEQLSESALAGQLGVSKTPVREALQQLRNEGLVRIVPHRHLRLHHERPRSEGFASCA